MKNILTETQAALYLKLKPSTLRKLRLAGWGPPHALIKNEPNTLRYLRRELDEWKATQP